MCLNYFNKDNLVISKVKIILEKKKKIVVFNLKQPFLKTVAFNLILMKYKKPKLYLKSLG